MYAIPQCPVVVLATYRTDEVHCNHPLWGVLPHLGRLGAQRMELDRLGKRDLEVWVRHLLPGEQVDDVVVRLMDRTAGNPLFAKELLQEAHRLGVQVLDMSDLPKTILQTILENAGNMNC